MQGSPACTWQGTFLSKHNRDNTLLWLRTLRVLGALLKRAGWWVGMQRKGFSHYQFPGSCWALAEPETGVTLKLTELYSLLNLLWTLHLKFGNIPDCQRFLIWYKRLQRNRCCPIWQPMEGFLINFKRSVWVLHKAGCIKHPHPSLEWSERSNWSHAKPISLTFLGRANFLFWNSVHKWFNLKNKIKPYQQHDLEGQWGLYINLALLF